MPASCDVDASAVLAHLFRQDGSDIALDWIAGRPAISIVNVYEVVSRLAERGQDEAGIRADLSDLALDVHDVSLDLALAAGMMRSPTKRKGLSQGDRSCLALARQLDRPAVTADRAWAAVADDIGATVELIR